MKPEIAKLWVEALRSGEYEQGYGQLRDHYNRFCCLGVLCNLHAQAHPDIAADQPGPCRYMGYYTFPPPAVRHWAGLNEFSYYAPGKTLADLNDSQNSFEVIASTIEKTVANL